MYSSGLYSTFISCFLIMSKFYAVRRGRQIGIFNTWEECKKQVHCYPGARYKSFKSRQEAQKFIDAGKDINIIKRSISGYKRSYHDNTDGSDDYSYTKRPKTCSIDEEMDRPVVFSDGCCYGNGRRNAKAGVGVYWGVDHPHNISERLQGHPTNQRAEVTSARRAIESAIAQSFQNVEVKTDSSYTIKAVTEWIPKWKINGWKTTNGANVKNREDLETLQDVCSKINVKWTHVAGHCGIPGNEAADTLAKAGSQKPLQ